MLLLLLSKHYRAECMLIETPPAQVIAALQNVGHFHRELAKAHRVANDAIQAYAQSLDHSDDPLALLATFPDVLEGAGAADKKAKAVSRPSSPSPRCARVHPTFPTSRTDLPN